MTFTIGSLFSGIGGLELGLEWAGLGPVLWQVEQDAYCRDVLAHHYPDAERFDDVQTAGAHNLARVDIICGGFPCQDISLVGAGEGIGGTRSGLWSEYARIIGELRPRYVVVENVAALLVRGMGDVLGDLAALGYDAWWDCIPAVSVGAPHRRDRVFIVAWRVADADSDRLQGVIQAGAAQGSTQRSGAVVADAASVGCEAVPTGVASRCGDPWETEPDVGRVADGVPARVDRLRALGNAVVPQCAEIVGWVIRELATEEA